MTTFKRSLLILGVGAAAVCATVGGAWFLNQRGHSFYTDGNSINVPANASPLRSILWQPATPLPGSINSTSDEYEPRVSADGTLMIFVRGKPGANTDLFQSKWTPDGWTDPVAIASVNTEHDELGPELSRDAKSLYFYSDRPGGVGGYDIWVAKASDDGWSLAVNLGPAINSPANEYGPALTPDGAELFFASNRPRPGEPTPERESWAATVRETRDRHDYDLYRASLSPNGIDSAIPVLELNTRADEGAPAISPAGDFLYFASDRDGGRGGFDIYRARRMGPTFASPENIGDAVNSAFSDLDPALSMDGFRLHFSSNRPQAPALDGTTTEDYGVWVSHSREVYLHSEASQAGLSDLLWSVVPWLLLLLLALLLSLLLLRLWQNPRLHGRFKRLSLLAQCLLVSLALHILIASLLALWKVGNQISNMLHEQGGTRVILASASDSDGFSSQLLGEITSEQSPPVSPELTAAELPSAALDSEQVRTDVSRSEVHESQHQIDTPESARDDTRRLSALPPSQTPDARASTVTPVAPEVSPASAPVQEDVLRTAASTEPAPTAAPAPPSLSAKTVQTLPLAIDSPAPGRLETLAPTEKADALVAQPSAPASPATTLPTSTIVDAAAPLSEAARASAKGEAHIAAPTVAGPAGAPANVLPPAARTERVELGVPATSVTDSSHAPDIRPIASRDAQSESKSSSTLAPVLAVPSPMSATAGVATPQIPAPQSAPSAAEPTLNGAPVATSGTHAAPLHSFNSAAPGSFRSETGTTVARDTAVVSLKADGETPTSIQAATSSPPAAIVAPLPAVAIGALPTPGTSPSRAGRTSTEAALGGTPKIASAAAPALATPSIGESSSLGAVRNNPVATRVTDSAPAILEVDRQGAAPSSDRSPSAPAAAQLPAPAVPALALGLPVAEEPPTPKETFAQRAPEVRTEILEKMGGNADTERAVGRALDWFSRHQEQNGSWTGRRFDARCRECGGEAEFDSDAAMTGLALLCYLGAGHTPDKDGPYRSVVAKAIDFLLARQDPSGDLRHDETMYSQSIATVALCEAYAMTRDKRLGDAARRAVAFMCEGVKRAGARRQDDRSRADDTSVLGWQVMAMESARRSGFEVPDTTFRSAAVFLDKVSTRSAPGRYAYRPGEAPSAAMTAEAMFVQQLMGHARPEPRMQESAAFILQTPPRWKDGASTYYWYYATLALFQHQGDAWRQWNESLVPELLANQRKDGGALGSWDPQDQWSRMGGRIYQTAVCTLSLEVYYRYKPAGTTLRPE